MSADLKPLAGLTVFERSLTPAGAHAGSVLSQLGASVGILPRTPQRLLPAESASLWDLGKETWDAVPGRVDVIIDDAALAGVPSGELPPSAAVVRILAADDVGDPSLRGRGTPLAASAVSGVAVALGDGQRTPLGLPPGVVETVTGSQAVAALLALLWRGLPEEGTVTIEIAANAAMEFFVGMNAKVFEGYPRQWRREGRRTAGSGGPYPAAIFPCRDGHLGIIGRTRENWEGILDAMGSPQWAQSDEMRDPYYVAEHAADLADKFVAEWSSGLTEAELTALSLEHGFVVAPIRTLPEVLAEPQYQHRGFWRPAPDGRRAPGLPFVVRRHAELPKVAFGPPGQRKESSASRGPFQIGATSPSELLEGLRVLDFSWVWAGPMVSMILADLGAEVIKVEHPSRPDTTRLRGRPSRDGVPVEGPELEVAPYFQQLNHAKRSLGSDLRDRDVQQMLAELAGAVDVVLENMRPGVLAAKGLGYEDLSQVNPALVMASMTLVGQDGPLSRMRGYAPVMSGLAGLEALIGYDNDLTGMYTFSFADANAGIYGVIGVLAALLQSRRTGQGAHVDLSQVEATITCLTLQLGVVQAGRELPVYPNRDERFAWQDVICTAGEDEWLALTARDEADLSRLADLVGVPTARGEILSGLLEQWARERELGRVIDELEATGAIAVPVLSWQQVSQRRADSAQPTTVAVEHPFQLSSTTYVPPWRYDGEIPSARQRAPFLGEHTRRIIAENELLDVGQTDQLLARGALVDAGAGTKDSNEKDEMR